MTGMDKEYLKLLAKREGREMLGSRFSNLWILSAVLAVALLAVSFSWAGKKYLEFKMADPFTNWVNVENNFGKGNYIDFFNDLSNQEICDRFQINSVSGDDYEADWFMGADGKERFLECRFFGDFDGSLIRGVLDSKNVVHRCSSDPETISNESYGLIITADALKKLGYSLDDVPAFINISQPAGDDFSLGMNLYEFEGTYYSMDPMPLLGVVKSLPMNMDIIGSHFWYSQSQDNIRYPFFINDPKYFDRDQLYYFVEEGKDSLFVNTISELPHESAKTPRTVLCEDEMEAFRPWKAGNFYQVMYGNASTSPEERAEYDRSVQERLSSNGVTRVYKYEEADTYENSDFLYYSVYFNDLKSIVEFEKYVKEEYKIQLEISQVTSKQNFRIVSTIANVLTVVMIAFAIICIVMYIINMLQAYFQKVKRNLGTFKAFGMESDSLIRVYVATLLLIVSAAIVISVFITLIISVALRVVGICWETGFPYFILFNWNTLISIMVVIIATAVTSARVMSRLFRNTPGDLIYDR